MIILAIESSCDDTSVALVKVTRGKFEILKELTASQIAIHKKYGGVVPEIAGRMHAEKIMPLIEEVISEIKNHKSEIINHPDVICVTSGPGLITGLLVGVEAAKTLSYLWNIPLVGVNHIEGHIHSVEIRNPKSEILNKSKIQNQKLINQLTNKPINYPALALIASGGHTELILMKKQGSYKKLGATLDDAAGECFDKVAKILGLEYPGGPKISQHAEHGNPKAINFPRPMLKKNNFNFSFAGLKTSALYWLRDNVKKRKNVTCYMLHDSCLNDFCASFEQAIIDVLVGKTLKAAQKFKPKNIILGGGVAANQKLRESLTNTITTLNCELRTPNLKYCMDNATMIAIAGYYHAKKKEFVKWNKIQADPNWEIT
jgi:N6-L-threonylcarbamoyladenine synthase